MHILENGKTSCIIFDLVVLVGVAEAYQRLSVFDRHANNPLCSRKSLKSVRGRRSNFRSRYPVLIEHCVFRQTSDRRQSGRRFVRGENRVPATFSVQHTPQTAKTKPGSHCHVCVLRRRSVFISTNEHVFVFAGRSFLFRHSPARRYRCF